jgi:hypothetical protein
MGLFDGDYKMTAQSQREAEVSRGADEAYAAQGELHAPVTHTPDHGITPEELADQKIRAAKSQAFDSGWEAGVQAERERIKKALKELNGFEFTKEHGIEARVKGYLIRRPDVLAVVTGKEGSSDE